MVSPSAVVIRVLSTVPLSVLKVVPLLPALHSPVGSTDGSIISLHRRRLMPTADTGGEVKNDAFSVLEIVRCRTW
jgi:hypothetical protein